MNLDKVIYKPNLYITVYKPIAGWKAVLMHKIEGPIQTGNLAWKHKKDAINDAKYWAKCEGLKYLNERGLECTQK